MLNEEKIRQLVRIAESDNSGIVTAWDLRDWTEADIQLFEQEKYLLFRGYADSIRCGRCHKGCTVEPTIARYPNGQQKGVFLCTDNDEGGRIEFDMEELRYWEINVATKTSVIELDLDQFSDNKKAEHDFKQEMTALAGKGYIKYQTNDEATKAARRIRERLKNTKYAAIKVRQDGNALKLADGIQIIIKK